MLEVTGLWAADDVAVARRVVDLRRIGNEREGWRPSDDGLPADLEEPPRAAWPSAPVFPPRV